MLARCIVIGSICILFIYLCFLWQVICRTASKLSKLCWPRRVLVPSGPVRLQTLGSRSVAELLRLNICYANIHISLTVYYVKRLLLFSSLCS